MKTILVSTDFSPAALNAVNYAADMAVAIKGDLLILHVNQFPVVYYELPIESSENYKLDEIEKLLNNLRQQISINTSGKINIKTELVTGIFYNELKAICDKVEPYAVVMGSQGTTAADRLLFGGHTVHAMTHLIWPLITVPPKVSFLSVKRIGLACDLQQVEENVPIDDIKTLIKDFNAELHILHIGKIDEFNPDVVFESGTLQRMLEPVKPTFHFIQNKNIDAGIIEFAAHNDINLLVVIPRRHSLLDHLVHNSHTKQLVLHSPVPVLAYHHS
ncbi:hypothetical protein BH11BAC3_BH11BAC3_00930 [soil metagenome]